MSEDVWAEGRSVWLTSLWGWSPESWGAVGFSDAGRRDTVRDQSSDPFIMVNYITEGSHGAAVEERGKVLGFYFVTHLKGDRNDFTAQRHHDELPGKWRYSLKAIRAFEFLPEYRIHRDELDPTIINRALAVARFAEPLDAERIDRLRNIPFREVPVFGSHLAIEGDIVVPWRGSQMVRAGPVNRMGYSVPGEPLDTVKELYAFVLDGDMLSYLKTPVADRKIYKIGLSISPATRLEVFRKSMPEGKFRWERHRSTRSDGHEPYPSFEAAEAGERAMKNTLGRIGEWLGGEFYAATAADFEKAWSAGRAAALAFAENGRDAR